MLVALRFKTVIDGGLVFMTDVFASEGEAGQLHCTATSCNLRLLELARLEIDKIDTKLLSLLSERAHIASRIAKIKEAQAPDASSERRPFLYYRPERESAIMRRLISCNRGAVATNQLHVIFTEIISSCRGLKCCLNIGFLSNSQGSDAIVQHFGNTVNALAYANVQVILSTLPQEQLDCAVLPAEIFYSLCFSASGNQLLSREIKVIGEIVLKRRYFVLACDEVIPQSGDDRTLFWVSTTEGMNDVIEIKLSQFKREVPSSHWKKKSCIVKGERLFYVLVECRLHAFEEKVSLFMAALRMLKKTAVFLLGTFPSAYI